jgi:hypothetical protein
MTIFSTSQGLIIWNNARNRKVVEIALGIVNEHRVVELLGLRNEEIELPQLQDWRVGLK